MKEFTPFKILIFLASCFLLLGALSFVMPEKGIYVTEDFSLRLPQLGNLFTADKQAKVDISEIIALDEIASVSTKPAATNAVKPAIKLNINIQYRPGDSTALDNFFASLQNISSEGHSIRVMHYGDSQIEGDRITDYLRLKLQSSFGGRGPGFISPVPVAPSVAVTNTWSNNWNRYTIFTVKDKNVAHNNFGPGASFCRFMPYPVEGDSVQTQEAWLKVQTNKAGGGTVSSYSNVKLFYAGANKATAFEFYENEILKKSDSLLAGGSFHIAEFNLEASPGNFEFKFKGDDSPDIFGISLESNSGVIVDNFGLRGSSGTFFRRLNLDHLKQFYDYFHVKLVILQFGGNSLPYINDTTKCIQFGNALQSQINAIKKIAPGASILVVGPADMSVKVGTEYSTHPQLERLRDEIRKAAFNTNAAFFDTYESMGGKNSMLSWVEAEIAATDYIHFSPAGARKIAILLYQAIIKDYNNYVLKNS
ncbi:MAG: GDSL-type esterase/lipase family protein [Chitinophagales bacterium]